MKSATTSTKKTKREAPASGDRKQESALRLWIVLARAFNSVTKLVVADIEQHGLTATEFGILEVLYHKERLTLGEIQRKILVTSGGITYLVDRLVEKGFVRREECPNDRRARYAVLTPAGQSLIRRIFPPHAARIEQAMSALSLTEQREATALMRKLGLAVAAEIGSEVGPD
jgi:MarR family 2-MHQ and catechol resistance regulon transcriptional repressor